MPYFSNCLCIKYLFDLYIAVDGSLAYCGAICWANLSASSTVLSLPFKT